MLKKGLREMIGTRAFYRSLALLVLPVMLQNTLTSLVSLLDNLMVGSLGTDQFNGVSIVNQLLFVFNLAIFGGLSGAGIFSAQFFGQGDARGVRDTFRFKLMLVLGICCVSGAVFLTGGDRLAALWMHEGSQTGDPAATAQYAHQYMEIMLLGLVPFALQQAYASTLRECGETAVPMKAGLAAITINLTLNWLLIGGHWGAPRLEARGAAIATVISRYAECAIIVIWCHRHPQKAVFIPGAYRSMRVPRNLLKNILFKGMPLLLNEVLWSMGMASVTQAYSTRGLAVVAGMNIASTISNLFGILWMSMGTAIAIMIGQQLGANEFDRVKRTRKQLTAFSVALAVLTGALLFLAAPLVPRLYNTTAEVRTLAVGFLRITACASPLYAYTHSAYFTLRAGGKTWITFLFDSVFVWVVKLLLLRLLLHFADLNELTVYALVEASDLIKCLFGSYLLRKEVWIHNIVEDA